jgi:hypothetical protein
MISHSKKMGSILSVTPFRTSFQTLEPNALHEPAGGAIYEAGQAHIKLAVAAVVEGVRAAGLVTCVAHDFRFWAVGWRDGAGAEEFQGARVVDVVEGR